MVGDGIGISVQKMEFWGELTWLLFVFDKVVSYGYRFALPSLLLRSFSS